MTSLVEREARGGLCDRGDDGEDGSDGGWKAAVLGGDAPWWGMKFLVWLCVDDLHPACERGRPCSCATESV